MQVFTNSFGRRSAFRPVRWFGSFQFEDPARLLKQKKSCKPYPFGAIQAQFSLEGNWE